MDFTDKYYVGGVGGLTMDGDPVAIDLFCGAGGLSQGLSDAGFEILLGIDDEPSAVDTFRENHDAPAICCDIQSIKLDRSAATLDSALESSDNAGCIPDHDVDEIDLVVGGPPCPTFSRVGRSKIGSLTGKRPETDERHELYEDFLRFVDCIEPTAFVLENVEGIVSAENSQGESVASIIQNELASLGYQVSVQVVDAANAGVPQHRRRAFFIGSCNGRPVPDLEDYYTHREPLHPSEKDLRTLWDDEPPVQTQKTLGDYEFSPPGDEGDDPGNFRERAPWITVAEAILDLPPVSPEGETPPKEATEYTVEPITEYQRWARDVDTDREGKVLFNHRCRGHNLYDLSLYKLLGEGVGWNIGELGQHLQPYRQDIFADKYKKQNPREPASTIIAHLAKDGHMFIHPREARSLTVREAARLQSFRDSFRFPEKRTMAFQLVGNAVPPRLAEVIGEAICEELLVE